MGVSATCFHLFAAGACLLLLALVACAQSDAARPCEAAGVSCQPRDVSGYQVYGRSDASSAGIVERTPTVEDVLEKGLRLAEASPVQIAVSAHASSDSVRCDWRGVARTPEQRADAIRFWIGLDADADVPDASYLETLFATTLDVLDPDYRETAKANFLAIARGGVSNDYLFLTCYAEYLVQEYLLGSGPNMLTVAYDQKGEARSYDLYKREHAAGQFGDDALMTASQYEATLDQKVADAVDELSRMLHLRQNVLFLAPMGAHNAISIEAWQVVEQWDIQRAADGTINAVRYGVSQDDPEYSLPAADLKRRITAAAGSDAFAGKRIANASGITQYYRDIGAYGDITPGDGETATFTPAQPPPKCGSAVADHAANPGLVQDCMALLAAKDELRGTGALNWSESRAIADWDGVKTTGAPARVTQLRIVDGRLTGTLPASLGKLPALTRLFLNGGELTGAIPPELGGLAALEQLRLNDNKLTGSIPPELGKLANLRELWISDNVLTGSIPSELGGLSKLEVLSLLNNGLTGSIPSELGRLGKLTQLSLSNNALTGSIPAELTNLRSLAWLRLGGNALTGCIPSPLRSVADQDIHRLRNLAEC